MATVINNPREQVNDSTGTGVVIGILLVVLLAILFLVFGLPYLRDGGTATPTGGADASLNINLPGDEGTAGSQ